MLSTSPLNRGYLLIFFLFLFSTVRGEEKHIRVKLFSTSKFQKASINAIEGKYYLLAFRKDGSSIDTIVDLGHQWQNFEFLRKGKSIHVSGSGNRLGPFERIRLLPAPNDSCIFGIKVNGKQREYTGRIDAWIQESKLLIVNEVPIEEYVAGVVESEGGHVPSFEYFKAQAILARTFALKNWEKHSSYGYNLKDDVTSQVYFHRAKNKYSDMILEAVDLTRDTVLVDIECDPILAVFHANSGGHTAPSEDAWRTRISYLRGRPDPYSLEGPSARWEKRILKKDMLSYLSSKSNLPSNDIRLTKALLNIPEGKRMGSLTLGDSKLKTRDIRTKFKLRSAYFSVQEDGEYFILKGRGFGHGVGMSQDGAMVMASEGYGYRAILSFYFIDIEFDTLDNL